MFFSFEGYAQYPPYPTGTDTVLIQVNTTQYDSLFVPNNIDCSNAIDIVSVDTFNFENVQKHYEVTDSIFIEIEDSLYYDTCSPCVNNEFQPVTSMSVSSQCGVKDLWFKVNFGLSDTLQISGSYFSFSIYGPCNNLLQCCTDIAQNYYPNNSFSYGHELMSSSLNNFQPGWYYVKVITNSCSGDLIFDYGTDTTSVDTTYNSDSTFIVEPVGGCENCITSFNPRPGEKYVITAWTKEDGAAATKTSYDKPEIYMEYPSVSVTQGAFQPSGEIIDGWQRIEGVFTIPPNATDFKIILTSTSGDVFFDDVKIHPYDSSMKSFVYDPVTKRLKATFDERHYATFYEYDKEGKLTRVKKETEKGIMTIKESRNNNSK